MDPFPDCSTPRPGIVSGGFVGFDVTYLALHRSSRRIYSLGDGYALNFRFGLVLWDQLVLGVSFGAMRPADHARTSEWVIWCRERFGVVEACDRTPSELKSQIKGPHVSPEVGYQYRFRPTRWMSMVPAVMLGYQATRGLRRQLDCVGCPNDTAVGVDMAGTYLAGIARITFGRRGFAGVVCRSQWFFAGAVRHMTGFGVELIAP